MGTPSHSAALAGNGRLPAVPKAGSGGQEEELVACDTRRWGCAVVRHEPQGGDRVGNTRGGGSS